MNVVDSIAWLEYFASGPNAGFFAKAIEDTQQLIVPTLSLFEVFKRVLEQRGEGDALQAVAVMRQGMVVDLDGAIVLRGAKLSLEYRLPMADSVMLATARSYDATVWTQDADFENVLGVQYRARRL
jgi:predicted nucleic acid-binding protein